MTDRMRPIGELILIKRDAAPTESAGGIIIPATAHEYTLTATVLAVGPGRWGDDGKRVPIQVKPGERVMVRSKYVGKEIERDGEKLIFCKEDDVVGVSE